MITDRDMLVGVLALQAGLLDAGTLSEATMAWSGDRSGSFLDLLLARGWVDEPGSILLARLADEKIAERVARAAELPSVEFDPSESVEVGSSVLEVPTIPGLERLMPDILRVSVLGGSGVGEGPSRYSRTHIHAKGGIGQVWLARDGDLGREVALKELRPEQAKNPTAWFRFLEEARITGQLEHPGIVPVYELASSPEDNKPFYTMRFIRGGTLLEATRSYHAKRVAGTAGSLEFNGLLQAFIAVCNAVAYAHSRGVIHRDLKGQNVVMGDFGEVMVLDWGLAKLVDEPADSPSKPGHEIIADDLAGHDATLQGQVLGTPSYMAPEQAEGRIEAISRRTDIYGLGAILYEILTGKPPYPGENTDEVLSRVRSKSPVAPREVVSSTPKALEAVCLKAMAKRPENRYETALVLAEEVRRWLADEPVEVFRDPLAVRVARWSKRHKSAVFTAAAVLMMLTVTLAASTFVIGRERDEARRHQLQARAAVDAMYTQVADQWLEDRLDPLQREILEKALAYSTEFTRPGETDPTLRQDRGRALLRLADVLRKLGEHDKAEATYRRSIAVLTELLTERPGSVEHLLNLAVAEARLASELSLRSSEPDRAEAEPLYRKALARHADLAGGQSDPYARLESIRAVRGFADLLRIAGRPSDAEIHFRKAIALGEAFGDGPGQLQAKQELAASFDGLGVLLREQDRRDLAEAADRRAIEILQPLVIQAPNLPQLRDGLAKAYNSLGLLVMESGDSPDAEAIFEQQVALNDRLAADFPTRPEYRRTLARGLKNLGLVYRESGRMKEAEAVYRRALALNQGLAAESPEIRNFLRDQATCLSNLGEIVSATSRRQESEGLYAKALKINEKLVRDEPGAPSHRQAVAGVLNNQGLWLRASGRSRDAIAAYERSAEILELLVVADPTNLAYRREQARSLSNLGNALLAEGRHGDAEVAYSRAIGRFDEIAARTSPTKPDQLELANCLSNRAANLTEGRLEGAEGSLRRALTLFDGIAAKPPLTPDVRRKLAACRINLGDFLRIERRWPEAELAYGEAVKMLDGLVAEFATSLDYKADLGDVLGGFGKLRLAENRPSEARLFFDRAVMAEREVLVANPRHLTIRKALGAHLETLAGLLLGEGNYSDAARTGEEMLRVMAEVPGTRGELARLMVKCVPLAERDGRLSPSRRATVAGSYADRAISLIREAVENKEPGSDRLVDDEVFAPIRSRDGFKTLRLGSSDELTRTGE